MIVMMYVIGSLLFFFGEGVTALSKLLNLLAVPLASFLIALSGRFISSSLFPNPRFKNREAKPRSPSPLLTCLHHFPSSWSQSSVDKLMCEQSSMIFLERSLCILHILESARICRYLSSSVWYYGPRELRRTAAKTLLVPSLADLRVSSLQMS